MKIILLYTLLFAGFANANIEMTSFYFKNESADLSDSSHDILKDFIKKMDVVDIQFIEINLFTVKSDPNSLLGEQRLDFIIGAMNIDEDMVAIQIHTDKNLESNQDRIDIYYSTGKKSKKNQTAFNGTHQQSSYTNQKTLTCLKPYRKPDLSYIVKGVPILLPIEFKGNNARIKPESNSILSALKVKLNGNITLTAHIRGHVCCGDRMRLSKRRAKEVYKYLVNNGIDPNRLSFDGYSNTVQLTSIERTEEDRSRNRRVDVIFD